MLEYLPKISNLFKKYGVISITTDDISRKLAISKKTLYRHFQNKKDVVFKVGQFEIQNEFSELENICINHFNVIDQLYIISKYILDKNYSLNPSLIYSMKKIYPDMWKDILNKRKAFVLNLIKNNYATGIENGMYKENLTREIVNIIYSFLLDIRNVEMNRDWLNNDLEKIFNAFFMYHIRGIADKKGIEYMENKFKEKKI